VKLIVRMTIIFLFFSSALTAYAKNKSIRKLQEVNFGEMNLKGTVRNPDGAYLVQKRGIRFKALHDVQEDMDIRIRETSLYMR
jgi:hypothetical protein